MTITTKAQRKALHRKWLQNNQGMSYREFRRTAVSAFISSCIMVPWCGIWLGIEKDGYTHS